MKQMDVMVMEGPFAEVFYLDAKLLQNSGLCKCGAKICSEMEGESTKICSEMEGKTTKICSKMEDKTTKIYIAVRGNLVLYISCDDAPAERAVER